MSHKIKKFQKMIRGDPSQQFFSKNETIEQVKSIELENLKLRIFLNSFDHIEDEILKEKCLDFIAHYHMFINDESHFKVNNLSDDEKIKFRKCIDMCIQKECAVIINEKELIYSDLFKCIESEPSMANTLKNQLNIYLSLLNKYTSNKNEIKNSIFKLLDSSHINILEAQKLNEQVDILKTNASELQNTIVSKFSCPEELFESMEKYYSIKEKEYITDLAKLENLQKLQDKYNQVDNEQFRALVKKFIKTKEIIKMKTMLFNN